MKRSTIIPVLAAIAISTSSFAQEGISSSWEREGFNENSYRGIHDSDIMWRKRVVRAMDLREKQNEPLFSRNREISKLLVEAVKQGKLTPYASDSLDAGRILTLEEFMKKLEIPGTEVNLDPAWNPEPIDTDDDWLIDDASSSTTDVTDGELDFDPFDPSNETPSGPELYAAPDLYQMEITEDVIFDKQRSQMKHDIQALTLFIPADHPLNIRGIQDPIASFSYKDLMKVFANDPRAIWYNPYNDAEHRSYADAFDLRLFSSYMIKVSNPNDDYLVDQYGGDQNTGIMASQWTAYEMLEFEHNLWEF